MMHLYSICLLKKYHLIVKNISLKGHKINGDFIGIFHNVSGIFLEQMLERLLKGILKGQIQDRSLRQVRKKL